MRVGPGSPVTIELIQKMVASLHHRGPDDSGIHVLADQSAGVGMARLSVIDLVSGHQPLSNETGDIWVVLNGEIYNYRQLREELAPRHQFQTNTDTEVIVHLYEEMGDAVVERLRGMFAVAILDTRKHRLMLARDRIGKKPLYYSLDPSRQSVVFGSEIKAVLVDPGVSREMDPLALEEYLSYGFVPCPRSIYRAIRKLPGGWTAVLDANGWQAGPYWSVQYGRTDAIAEQDAVNEFDQRLTEAVRMRLISDVPTGVFLSGGMDSAVVTAIMCRLHNEPVRTFTVGFPDRDYDEMKAASRTATHCRTLHTELMSDWDIQPLVPILARHFDEPFADSSAVPTYRVSQIAKEHITVALSGEGGDELLGGYNRYQAQRIVDLYHRLPRLLRPQWVESMILGFRTPTTYFGSSLLKSSQYFLEFARGVRKKGWQSWLLYFDEPFRQTLLTPAARDMIADAHARPDARQEQDIEQVIEKSASLRGVERLMWIDLMTYLPDDILVKVDRMSMAVGLECRAPLLDHKLIEWLARIPLDLKLRGMTRKYLLRRLAERYFPKNMFNGPKRGFMMPLAGWLHGNLGQWILDRLRANDPFNKLVSMPAVDMLFESHRAKKDDHSYRIWALLMLAEFLQLAEVSI